MRSGAEGLIAWKLDVSLMVLKAGVLGTDGERDRLGQGARK
jgi:hypothetical protein